MVQIFAGKMLAGIFIRGNLFLRIAGKIAKLEPAKISCHTVGSGFGEPGTDGTPPPRVPRSTPGGGG